jgi:hypothetical protein
MEMGGVTWEKVQVDKMRRSQEQSIQNPRVHPFKEVSKTGKKSVERQEFGNGVSGLTRRIEAEEG